MGEKEDPKGVKREVGSICEESNGGERFEEWDIWREVGRE